MHITLTPVRHDAPLKLHRAGDVLTINDVAYDLSGIPDGATLPQGAVACNWLASDITRTGGELYLTLILPHGASAPQETLFPTALHLTEDRTVDLPPYTLEFTDAD